jgi:tRNA1(Val) A37 N6-methylase TrmN6
MDGQLTEDRLLDGKVRLLQPEAGYRAAIDPVLLAAAVPAKGGDRVLDAGCGAGASLLCLAARCPELVVTGIEIDAATCALAERNIALNGWQERLAAVAGSIAAPPPPLAEGGFDQVMTNPPYLAQGTRPPDASRATAHMEGVLDLAGWLEACLALLRPKGTLTLIHRADRLDAVLAALHGKAGEAMILPLWPMAGRPAKRVLVRARKGVRGPASLLPGLVLHQPDGAYTPGAEAILRGGKALEV